MSSTDEESTYDPTFRQRSVDKRLEKHDARIKKNEKRWLMTKGALATLAAVKGIDFTIAQLGSLL